MGLKDKLKHLVGKADELVDEKVENNKEAGLDGQIIIDATYAASGRLPPNLTLGTIKAIKDGAKQYVDDVKEGKFSDEWPPDM